MHHRIHIRQGTSPDWPDLAELFHQTIHEGANLYTKAQRQAWSPAPPEGANWTRRLDAQTVLIACMADWPVGFISLAPHGYIDFAYIRRAYQGRGLFRQLYQAIETKARGDQIKALTTHASLHAGPAFKRLGFICLTPETPFLRGQYLPRFYMQKYLSP